MAAVQARLGKALDAWMAQQGDKGLKTENNALRRQPKHAGKADGKGDAPAPKAGKKAQRKAAQEPA